MASTPKKALVLGLDCSLRPMIEKFIGEGVLPNFKKFFEGGVVGENCLSTLPTITPPNWTGIATGATPGTTGVTDFHYLMPDNPPDNRFSRQAFDSSLVQAETIWEVLDKAGKKCIVFNYPVSWPSKMKKGIMVGGRALLPTENRAHLPTLRTEISFSGDLLVSTELYPRQVKGEFVQAANWKNVGPMGEEPREMTFKLQFPHCMEKPAETTWHILIHRTGDDDRYDQMTLSPTKDFKDAFCTLSVGQWSNKIRTKIRMEDGSEKEVTFKCKLLKLSEDGEDLLLFLSALTASDSIISNPPHIGRELFDLEGGNLYEDYAAVLTLLGFIDPMIFAEACEDINEWMAQAVEHLMGK